MLQDATTFVTDSLAVLYPHHQVQLVPLYNGGFYSAYVFRRFDDVRLVLAPELQIGYFGGDADNFTFPRYAIDFSFFRIYEDGLPLENEYFFPWSESGASEGDAVFAIGNPGSTFRLETVAQLEYRRDVLDGYVLNLINSRLAALEHFLRDYPDEATEELRNQTFGLLNAQKLYRGRVRALSDPTILERRGESEFAFSAAVSRDEDLNARYGDLIELMAEAQSTRRTLAPEFGAFLSLNTASGLSSSTEKRALAALAYLDALEQGTDSTAALEALINIPDLPAGLEARFLEARLRDFVTYFGSEDPLVIQTLEGASPPDRATDLLESTVLDSAEQLENAMESGEVLSDDPAIQWARAFQERLQRYQSASAGLVATQGSLASRLGKARFEVYGTAFPPDATFSLRISDGVVRGYEYNGTFSPAFTTFFGLYDRHFSHEGEPEWGLPNGWLDAADKLVLSMPVNFVSTADITGGSSGSPVVNRDLELVGLIFDGNIESLSGDFIYLDDAERSVSVDVRGMLQALKHVYRADRLVSELTTGHLLETSLDGESR